MEKEKEQLFEAEFLSRKNAEFKQALRKRKEELPEILNRLEEYSDLLSILLIEPDFMLAQVPLHDAVQFHSVNAPEITSLEMIEPCLQINADALKNNKKVTILKEQDKRLKALAKEAKKEDADIIHSFTEIVDNLERFMSVGQKRVVVATLVRINQKAIENVKASIENYKGLTI